MGNHSLKALCVGRTLSLGNQPMNTYETKDSCRSMKNVRRHQSRVDWSWCNRMALDNIKWLNPRNCGRRSIDSWSGTISLGVVAQCSLLGIYPSMCVVMCACRLLNNWMAVHSKHFSFGSVFMECPVPVLCSSSRTTAGIQSHDIERESSVALLCWWMRDCYTRCTHNRVSTA